MIEMTQFRRDLMLRIVDAHPGVPPIMFHIHHMVRCDEILLWLVKHRYTGKEFLAWIKNVHQNSTLNMLSFVLKQLEKQKHGRRPIYLGVDYN